MLEILNQFFLNNGFWALFVIMFLNMTIFIPPSEIILPMVGFLSYTSGASLILAIIIATTANLLGTYIWYLIGKKIGSRWILKIKYFKKRFPEESFHKMIKKFHKQEAHWVMTFRFFPLIRAFISIPAGMIKMPQKIFLIYSFIGIIIWVTSWTLIGYFLGASFINYKIYITLILVILLIISSLIFHSKIKKYLKEERLTI